MRIAIKGTGIEGAVVFAPGRVLGRTASAAAAVEVPAAQRGPGPGANGAPRRGGPPPADGGKPKPGRGPVG
ncbi:MAG: ABC transporter permease, partial [Planctomycetaceae bacterium]